MAWGFVKRRVVIATLGALLFGGVGSAVGVAQVYHPAPATATHGGSHGTQGLNGLIGAGPAATNTSTSAPPTDTAAPPPPQSTATPRPTPTPPVPGTNGQYQGTVRAVLNATAFTIRVGTSVFTIDVNTPGKPTAIQINGVAAPDVSGLTAGMSADVAGAWYSGSTLYAISVDAQTSIDH